LEYCWNYTLTDGYCFVTNAIKKLNRVRVEKKYHLKIPFHWGCFTSFHHKLYPKYLQKWLIHSIHYFKTLCINLKTWMNIECKGYQCPHNNFIWIFLLCIKLSNFSWSHKNTLKDFTISHFLWLQLNIIWTRNKYRLNLWTQFNFKKTFFKSDLTFL
jgi:hypothetical protein